MIDARGRIGAPHRAIVVSTVRTIDWCRLLGRRQTCWQVPLCFPSATAAAYEAAAARPFAERLIASARCRAGSRRATSAGKQAAAVFDRDDGGLSLRSIFRVDDHHEPIAELERLYEKSGDRFQPFVACLPSREIVRPGSSIAR